MENALPGADTILLIKNLIRYDIPILMVGSSSIGKSFTVIALSKEYRIPNQVLYVGSEKADNIEGLPKLTGLSADDDKLKYLKPYWFPKSERITLCVKRGKEIFDTIVAKIYGNNFAFTYTNIEELFEKVAQTKYAGPAATTAEILINKRRHTFERKIVGATALEYDDDLRDLSLFLSTLLGFGNYWLILDELDKVQEIDADKYAPMLHIVRERTLKGYQMREFNDGEGANVGINVKGDDYKIVYNKISEYISADLSLLDTRIIAVANQSENIDEISEALFRRFVQVLVDSVLVLKPVEEDVAFMANCIKENYKAVIPKNVPIALLPEINLQWEYGFLPAIANKGDSGNWIRDNFIKVIKKSGIATEGLSADTLRETVYRASDGSALRKILEDNFSEEELIKHVLYCFYLRWLGEADQKKNNQFFAGGIANGALRDIGEKKKLGFDSKNIADDIEDTWYKDLREVVIKDDKSRVYELESLIRRAFEYVKASVGAESSITEELLTENSMPDLVTYLIPKYLRFCYSSFVNDNVISADDIAVLFTSTHFLLEEFGRIIKKGSNFSKEYIEIANNGRVQIQCNIDEVKSIFYNGENSFFGTLERGDNYFTDERFKQGLIYRFYSRTAFAFRREYIESVITGVSNGTAKPVDRFHQEICNFLIIENYNELKSYFNERAVALLKSKNSSAAKKYLDLKKDWETFSRPLRTKLNLPL